MPYLSSSAVVIQYEEALYQVYAPLPYLYLLPFIVTVSFSGYNCYSSLIPSQFNGHSTAWGNGI